MSKIAPPQSVYLDHASTTPIAPIVLTKMLPYMQGRYANPSALYSEASRVRSEIEKARRTLKTLIGGKEGNLVFTSGGTEANNLAIQGIIKSQKVSHIVTSPLEHTSVLDTVRECQMQGIACHDVPLTQDGAIDYTGLEQLLQRYPKAFVSLMHGNNEIGNITNIARVGALCRQYDALLHSDMVQTLGYYPIDLTTWGVDLCTGSAHKFYGPKGIGFLYIGPGIRIAPLLYGGQQERGLRGGTENVAGIIGMAAALEAMHAQQDTHRAYLLELKRYISEKLLAAIPNIKFHGQCLDMQHSLCNILNMSIPHLEKETCILQLAIEGVAASSGSACMSGSKATSHVLQALGISDQEAAIRLSLGIHNTHEELDYTLSVLKKLH